MPHTGLSRRRIKRDSPALLQAQRAGDSHHRAAAASHELPTPPPRKAPTPQDILEATLKHGFWQVQHLKLLEVPRESATGLGSYFESPCLSSPKITEHAASRSLRHISDLGHIISFGLEYPFQGVVRSVFFVGPDEGIVDKVIGFTEWFMRQSLRSQEPSLFDVAYLGGYKLRFGRKVWQDEVPDAWWSIDCDLMWTLDEDIAQLLVKGLRA